MGFDVDHLRATIAKHGPVARVVVAGNEGSTPREVGAAMLVWADGQDGTIGGGTLEYQSVEAARKRLATGAKDILERHALGPEMGQCCGGAVRLLTEIYDAERAASLTGDMIVRTTGADEMPLSVHRVLSDARASGVRPGAQLVQGWMIEPVQKPTRQLWVWGAGHVGRAIVSTIAPLPDVAITWIDTAADRFPVGNPYGSYGVSVLPAADPAILAAHAPTDAEHLILTYSHELDLALCHGLLARGFKWAGLIGSKTKWARFRSRLRNLGHSDTQIARITCPIGDPALGKHPQQIALGVATEFMVRAATPDTVGKENMA